MIAGDAWVSVKRLQKFFYEEEFEDIPKGHDEEYPVSIENGEFQWKNVEVKQKTQKRAKIFGIPLIPRLRRNRKGFSSGGNGGFSRLENINLWIKKGSLVAIVGPVGSGKSSLLQAIIGEMPRTSIDTKISITGSVAYTSQQAWIQNATLKSLFILFF